MKYDCDNKKRDEWCMGVKAKIDGPVTLPGPFCIEAVIVCDKFSDFLAHTIQNNKILFNNMVVVTSYEDVETQKLCEFYYVKVVTTDRTESRKKKFCKGAAINDGLEHLSMRGWVVHLDADILLPPETRRILERANLNPNMVYGIDRFDIKGYDEFAEFRNAPPLQHEADSYIHTQAFPLGHRLMLGHADGYVPLGFFQMWAPSMSGIVKYPEGHDNAGREDLLFAMQWPRSHRAMIPEIIGYHLTTEDTGFGTNWNGRKTKKFKHGS